MHRKKIECLLLFSLVVATVTSCHWFRRSVPVEVRPAPAETKPAPEPPPPPPVTPVTPEAGGYVTFALEEPFTTLEAAKIATSSDRMIRRLVFRGLSRETSQGTIKPELAAGWEILRKGREWILHLRPQTPLGRGRYLEARHVVASWEALVADPTSPHSWLLEPIRGFEAMSQGETSHLAGLILEDGLTLRLELERPVPDLPWRLAHPALAVSAFGADQEGIGPYLLWSVSEEDEVVLRSNPDYFGDLPLLEELVFLGGESADPVHLATGELDGVMVSTSEASPASEGLRLFSHSMPRTYILGLNRGVAPFSSPARVQALLDSLDRFALLRSVGASGAWVPETLVFTLAPGLETETSPFKALRGSGWGRLDLVFPRTDPVAKRLAETLRTRFTKAGARVVMHAARFSDIAGILRRNEYHLFVLPYLPSSLSSILNYEELIRWNRSIPDALLTRLQSLENEGDPQARVAALRELDASIQAKGYLVPLMSTSRRFLVREEICRLRPDPLGSLDWTVAWRNTHPPRGCGEPPKTVP